MAAKENTVALALPFDVAEPAATLAGAFDSSSYWAAAAARLPIAERRSFVAGLNIFRVTYSCSCLSIVTP